MTARTRKATAQPVTVTGESGPELPVPEETGHVAEADTTAEAPDVTEVPADSVDLAPMECTANGCEESEEDDKGVCPTHYEAGWRYVKEPDRD